MQSNRVVTALLFLALAGSATDSVADEALTGNFRVTHTTTEAFDAPTAEALASVIALDEELQWQVFVPESYDPNRPPGVFVFADPYGWGGMPDQYRQLFTNRNMIWIGARSNERAPSESKKMLQAMMAERIIDKAYRINRNRLYVGSAGDGATTAINLMLKSNDYRGGLYLNGSAYWHGGMPENFDFLLRKRHAFIIGSGDKRLQTVRNDYENYKKDGIVNAKLFFRPGTIRDWPDVEQMDEALAYLDGR